MKRIYVWFQKNGLSYECTEWFEKNEEHDVSTFELHRQKWESVMKMLTMNASQNRKYTDKGFTTKDVDIEWQLIEDVLI